MLRVGVFMGGRSVENEASFNSGRTVCDHLDSSRYDIIPLFQRRDGALFILPWNFLHRGKTTDFEHRLDVQAKRIAWDDLKKLVDFVYLAIHGRYAEDGCLQGFLDVLGIPYLGSGVLASALCMDKGFQKKLLNAHGIATPQGISLSPHDLATLDDEVIIQRLEDVGLVPPYIVKPHKEGSSLGVSIVNKNSELRAALTLACFLQPATPQTVIVEEFIQGMEFSCIILIDYNTGKVLPLPPTEIIPETGTYFFDYQQKYMPGRAIKFTPARCEPFQIELIQKKCIQVMQLFNIKTIARIDGFLTEDNRIIIVDPNTLCGMGPTSFLFRQAAEINMGYSNVINHLIETELHDRGIVRNIF